MSTLRQIEANRRNAQKSTGPTSVTGKAASSMNALKTGIHAKSLIVPTEKLADLELLIDEYYSHHHPASPEARCLLDDLIRCEWLLRRFDRAEAQMWKYQNDNHYDASSKYPLGKPASSQPASYSKLQYRVDATRRARDRALKSFKQLQAESAAAPTPCPVVEPIEPPSLNPTPQSTSPQIGFVPPTLPQPAPETPNPPLSLSPGLAQIRLAPQTLPQGRIKNCLTSS
jgi:hypothetical protein